MAAAPPGGSRFDLAAGNVHTTLEELQDRNRNAVAMDVLYLLTTAFFAHVAARGFWPAVIAAVPLAAFLYFGWRASWAFFGAQVVAIVVAIAATYAGVVPL